MLLLKQHKNERKQIYNIINKMSINSWKKKWIIIIYLKTQLFPLVYAMHIWVWKPQYKTYHIITFVEIDETNK